MHFLAYPFLTAQRRMEAQTKQPGMLHPRYHNYFSCLYHSFTEEGIKGLYKGFPPYMLATIITISCVPFLAEEMLKRSHLYGVNNARDKNEELYEEVIEGKKRLSKK